MKDGQKEDDRARKLMVGCFLWYKKAKALKSFEDPKQPFGDYRTDISYACVKQIHLN